MKLILILVVSFRVWSAEGHGDYQRIQRSPVDCGVQLTRGKGGGVYYAFGASNYGSGSGVVYQKAVAASVPPNYASSSSMVTNGNRDYYGGYGRYPVTAGQAGYQGSLSSSSQYGGSSGWGGNGANYGSSSSSSLYGSQSGGNYDKNRGSGYGSSSSGNIGGSSAWSQGASAYYNDARFTSDVLSAHNSNRARHNTPPVTLDTQMSVKAQQWAEELASGRSPYGPSPDAVEGLYGESLQVVNDPYPSALDVMDRWYDERLNYDFKSPKIVKKPFNQRNSHFTAMIWYGTRRIGVGKATSPINGKSYVVVTYYPPGNNVDILENNVFPPKTI